MLSSFIILHRKSVRPESIAIPSYKTDRKDSAILSYAYAVFALRYSLLILWVFPTVLESTLVIGRAGNRGVRVSVFASKSCVFLAVCGQILKFFGGDL